jgi:hypothetical protein
MFTNGAWNIMKSKKQLFKDLDEILGTKETDLNSTGINNETYGTKSVVYVRLAGMEQRNMVQTELEYLGHNVDRRYSCEEPVTAIQVNYFQGRNWDR